MHLTIKTKLLASFSAVLAMSAITGAIGVYELGQSNARMTAFVTGPFARATELATINDEIAQTGRLISNVILSNDDAAMSSMRAAYDTVASDYSRRLTSYAAFRPPDRTGDVDDVMSTVKSIDAVGRQAMDLAQRNDVVKATELSRGHGSAIGRRLALSLASMRDELVWLDGPEQAQAVTSQLGSDVPTVWRMVMTSLAETDAGELDRLGQDVHHQIKAIDEKLASVDASLKLAQLELPAFPRVNRLWAEFKPVAEQLLGYGTSSATFRAAELQRSKIVPAFAALTAKLEAMTVREQAAAKQSAADTATSYALTRDMLIALVLGALAISMVAAALLLRSVGRPIVLMTQVMTKLAAGQHEVDVPARDRQDEIGAMAAAIQGFKESGLDKLRLEREATESRNRAEAERSRTEAERERIAAEQKTVVTGLARGLGLLADGNLVFRLNEAFAREYEQLRADFNAAMDKLQGTMQTITANTEAIRSGSSEVSVAANDLAKRTEQQAASLEETAAALDEITATVKKTADGARQARDVVAATKQSAERSSVVVGRAVDAMMAIERSSQEVSQIIGVIDEIAFQTNLLALNAGVEAARAGEAGRGFAVVASEVRALAQRSAEAAKEIKALISTSAGQVDEGVGLVGQTGDALRLIAGQVTEVHSIVAEISASAQEQATGLDQVNTAVNQMDQVTQQNAAMVEETTAASHSLAGEAATLAQIVARFDVGQAADEGQAYKGAVPRVPMGRRLPGRGRAALAAAVVPEHGRNEWEEF